MVFTRTLFALYACVLAADAQSAEDEPLNADVEHDSLTEDQMRKLHAKFDHNKDGLVGIDELMNFATQISAVIAKKDVLSVVEGIDTSKDGLISLEEHMTDLHSHADGGDDAETKALYSRMQLETEKFKAADKNADGHLDVTELPALFYPEVDDKVMAIVTQETMRLKDTSGDGKLAPAEFWEAQARPADDFSEEEINEFGKVDVNGDGFVDLSELRAWESGQFHSTDAMQKMLDIADTDHDLHVTAQELVSARLEIAASDANFHLREWDEHADL